MVGGDARNFRIFTAAEKLTLFQMRASIGKIFYFEFAQA